MRFSIQIVLFLLGVNSVFSQVGIGTENPEPSAALEIFASDKGILIPRVSLQSTTDQTTITGALSNGLLVFNTSINNNLQPGFYYWHANLWHRLESVEDTFIETLTKLQLQSDGTSLEYIDEEGNIHVIDLMQILRDNELRFHLEDGSYTTISETIVENETTYQVHVPVAIGADNNAPTSYGLVKELSLDPQVTLSQQGELMLNYENIHKVVSVTSDYMISSNDAVILGNPMHSDINISLPDPTTHKGKVYTIKKENEGEDYYVNVIGNIAGIFNQELYTAAPHSGWRFISDGTQWHVESKF